jgi:hypothetical protein
MQQVYEGKVVRAVEIVLRGVVDLHRACCGYNSAGSKGRWV